ncbi:hypothetical protein HC62_16710 [Acetobacter tropicalis]|uniref:Uncharacterized protein n=1 Tax=Acetobacter tropicalis TaxID=104102 RepID=A0A252A159_9PROT|nr:hypothetical protein HC62_16710 [Acetobacter tropicalis]
MQKHGKHDPSEGNWYADSKCTTWFAKRVGGQSISTLDSLQDEMTLLAVKTSYFREALTTGGTVQEASPNKTLQSLHMLCHHLGGKVEVLGCGRKRPGFHDPDKDFHAGQTV